MKVGEQQKHKRTEYMIRRSGWLRVRLKPTSKRKRRHLERQAVRCAAESSEATRVHKRALAVHDGQARRRKRRRDKAKAEQQETCCPLT